MMERTSAKAAPSVARQLRLFDSCYYKEGKQGASFKPEAPDSHEHTMALFKMELWRSFDEFEERGFRAPNVVVEEITNGRLGNAYGVVVDNPINPEDLVVGANLEILSGEGPTVTLATARHEAFHAVFRQALRSMKQAYPSNQHRPARKYEERMARLEELAAFQDRDGITVDNPYVYANMLAIAHPWLMHDSRFILNTVEEHNYPELLSLLPRHGNLSNLQDFVLRGGLPALETAAAELDAAGEAQVQDFASRNRDAIIGIICSYGGKTYDSQMANMQLLRRHAPAEENKAGDIASNGCTAPFATA